MVDECKGKQFYSEKYYYGKTPMEMFENLLQIAKEQMLGYNRTVTFLQERKSVLE
jgi:hypothetical protein